MSIYEMRQAAGIMRKTAMAATEVWGALQWRAVHAKKPYARGVRTPDLDRHFVATNGEYGSILLTSGWDETQVVDHAASWSPKVALAVADLIDAIAKSMHGTSPGVVSVEEEAKAVVRAYMEDT